MAVSTAVSITDSFSPDDDDDEDDEAASSSPTSSSSAAPPLGAGSEVSTASPKTSLDSSALMSRALPY